MLMVMGMPLALFSAEATRGRAGLNDRSYLLCVELCLPRHNTAGRDARVTAIEAEPDASNERCDIVLTEAGIRARRTRLSTGEACLDAFEEGGAIDGQRPRMCAEDLFGERHRTHSFPCSIDERPAFVISWSAFPVRPTVSRAGTS